jgi:hypothetical protein
LIAPALPASMGGRRSPASPVATTDGVSRASSRPSLFRPRQSGQESGPDPLTPQDLP